MNYQVNITEAVEKLAKDGAATFVKVMKHGNMSVELYAPVEKDLQTPHKQDEIYIVISGSGTFYRDGE